ncbi:unnamed protein product [Rhizoctonia solani]|uniref:Uncharacterized protein n=1 Tax=Rhizoctonia solani TaxID=456999 RepID=A0A8H2XL50_9AGAM|nr:unnamed protein product [Rhizoctonia solani]
MGTTFDPDEVSDREVLPRTPTLAGSTSSLDDSLLQSPHSTRFLSASASSPTKRLSSPSSRTALEGNCMAWWGERISTDSSNWRASLDLRPLESLSVGLSSHEAVGPLKSRSQSDETASITPAPTPNCGRSVSEAKGSPPPNAEELDAEQDVESPCYPHFQKGALASVGLSQSSISSLPILSSVGQPQVTETKTDRTNGDGAPPNPLVTCLSVAHQSVDSEPLYPPSIALSPLLNNSLANSSMLAHCDQSSLAPPCASMTQTQSGRSALREAGIAHGSPRALAPSLAIENVPNRSHNESFFQRLMRKTFPMSAFATSTRGSNSLPTRSATSIGNQKSQRSRPTRHNTMPARIRATAPPSSQEPSTLKKSRWALIQRFVAKPSTAAKAAGANVMNQPRTQPRTGGVGYTRRHPVISGHSSVVSFFGDPLVRVDPFARSGGLGATVSPIGANPSEPLWNEALRAGDPDAHILSFPARESRNQSQGSDINEAEADGSSLRPPGVPLSMSITGSGTQASPSSIFPLPALVESRSMGRSMGYLGGNPTITKADRRHSAPWLSTLSGSVATSP